MKQKQQGIILLSIMILLLVISLNVVNQLQSMRLLFKLVDNQQKSDKKRWNRENTLQGLINNTVWLSGCHNENETVRRCSIIHNDANYEVVIEDLGVEPCLLIDNKPSQHWLLRLIEKEAELTVRIARKVTMDSHCTGNEQRFISSGIQSWYSDS